MDHSLKTFASVEGPSRPARKIEQSGNVYTNENGNRDHEAKRTGPALSDLKKSSSCITAAVCLGLLCLLLLIGLSITQVLLHTKDNSERSQLQTSYNDLTKERDQLQTRNNNLTKERDQLQTSYNDLTKERDQLQTSYNDLTKERDQLQTRNNDLTKERDQLQTSNNNLTKERDQLQTSNNDLTKERDQLQTRNNNLTKEQDQLQKKFDDMAKEKNYLERYFQELGHVYFSGSIYYISSGEKSWTQSRVDCQQRGGDLVIINSKEEQEFLRNLQRRVWIGLSDSHAEGIWKWVDGTPLSTSYWAPGEPNNWWQTDGEDCAEMLKTDVPGENNWNDRRCSDVSSWICEFTSP